MKRRDAFTMTELLVLIPIAGLLGVLLLPALGDAKEKAKVAVCMNNLREIGVAISMYANDHNDYYPPGFASVTDWALLIDPYLGKKPNTYGNPFERSKAFLCPAGVQSQSNLQVTLMYSAHTRLMPASSSGYTLYKRGRVARLSEMVLVTEGIQQNVYYPGSFDAAANFSGVLLSKLHYIPATADTVLTMTQLARDNTDCLNCPGNVGMIRLRHFGNTGANFLFCDGHVESKVVGQLKARNFMYDP